MSDYHGIEEDDADAAPIAIPHQRQASPAVKRPDAPLYEHEKHPMFIWIGLIFLPLLTLIIWVACFVVGQLIMGFLRMLGSSLGIAEAIPGGIVDIGLPLLVSVVATFWLGQKLLHRYVVWRYRNLRITEESVSLPTELPNDFLIAVSGVKNDHPVIPRSKELTARVTQGWWGKKFGFAKVSFDTPSQKIDEQFHDMRFISYPERIKELFPK